MALEKIETKKRSARVAEQILKAIRTGEYKVGQKLPPEREICEKTGVSRPSAREALSALQIVGVVETFPGDGTYVRSVPDEENKDYRAFSILEKSYSPFKMLEARAVFEPSIAESIIEQVTSEDIRRAEETLVDMRRAIASHDEHEFYKSDEKFHLTLAKATNNPVMVHIMRFLIKVLDQPILRDLKKNLFSDEEHVRDVVACHEQILAHIKKRNIEGTRNLVRKHIHKTRDYLLRD